MTERRIHAIFEASTLHHGLHGLAECIGGLMLAIVSAPALMHVVGRLTQAELDQRPHDALATHLMLWVSHFSTGSKSLCALYLLGHGLTRIVLAVALMRDKRGTYPTSLTAGGLFY